MKYKVQIPTTIVYQVDAEDSDTAEQKAKTMLYDELGVKPNNALGDIQTEKLEA